MIPKLKNVKGRMLLKPLIIIGIASALSIVAWPVEAQQTQPADNQGTVAPPESQGPAQTADPTQQPADAQAPQGQPEQPPIQGQTESQPPQGQYGPQPNQQAQDPAPNQAVPPQTLTLPAGTVIRVRTGEWLSSDRNAIGDTFSAELSQPLVVDGWVVARRGQSETGRVSTVKSGGHGTGTSQLGVELPTLTLVDGQQLPLETQLFQASGPSSTDRNVATVGTTTGLGAVIGAIAGGGTGAAIGAGLGATAGIIGVMSTSGRPTVIPPESVLSFKLKSPVTISTEKSQFAFQPVTQSDYDSRTPQNRPRMMRPVPPPYPYGPAPYPYAYAYPYPWYPAPFVGFGYYGRVGGWR
jgi:hypothetical protein